MSVATARSLNVSRETFERLEVYVSLLKKWSPRINLVSRNTLDDIWDRHIRDSLQVIEAAENCTGHWVDIGSGGGLPGLVVALSGSETRAVTLIESDTRKATFLRTVLRETGIKATVIADRIETAAPQDATILSARALAVLPVLLDHCTRHLAPEGTAIFPKGISWRNELEDARKSFSFTCDKFKSKTQDGAVILRIGAISRV